MVCIAEHWLNLVIAMVGERFTDGVGMMNENNIIENKNNNRNLNDNH